jgi:hypothetical protein
MEQEGATIFNGARYKPLPAIAQASMAHYLMLTLPWHWTNVGQSTACRHCQHA